MDAKNIILRYYRQKCDAVKEIPSGVDQSTVFQRLIYVSLLDAMSRIIYPEYNNRDRFTSYVKGFAQWQDCTRLSLTHLKRFLTINRQPEYGQIRTYVYNAISKWMPGEIITIDKEPEIELLRPLWPAANESSRKLNMSIESFQHLYLLYELRNCLVHECTALGNSGFDEFQTIPYYMHTTTYESLDQGVPRDSWELCYPLSFLSYLVQSSLHALEQFSLTNDVDWAQFLDTGTYWIKSIAE